VRERDEFDRGRVPGASNVPFWRFLISVPDVPAARHERVVVYCGQGPRAAIAHIVLRLRGYRHVELMDGHWAGWQQAALPEEHSA